MIEKAKMAYLTSTSECRETKKEPSCCLRDMKNLYIPSLPHLLVELSWRKFNSSPVDLVPPTTRTTATGDCQRTDRCIGRKQVRCLARTTTESAFRMLPCHNFVDHSLNKRVWFPYHQTKRIYVTSAYCQDRAQPVVSKMIGQSRKATMVDSHLD